jgi:hypothetical protein
MAKLSKNGGSDDFSSPGSAFASLFIEQAYKDGSSHISVRIRFIRIIDKIFYLRKQG